MWVTAYIMPSRVVWCMWLLPVESISGIFAATIICYVVSSGFSVHTMPSATNGTDIIPIMPKIV